MTVLLKADAKTLYVPDELAALVERRQYLSDYVVKDKEDKLALSLMWEALADEFEKINYQTNAWMCRKKATFYSL